MIEFAAGEARRRGLYQLRLFTNALMAANIARYAHLGFGETHRHRALGYDRVDMNMTLDLRFVSRGTDCCAAPVSLKPL